MIMQMIVLRIIHEKGTFGKILVVALMLQVHK
jgi:hypothetical protein